MIAAVFSELSNTAHHQGLEAIGIASALVNRALDDNPAHAFHNTGDFSSDVTRHSKSSQVQGTGNSQYALALAHINSGAALPDRASQVKFDLVVRATGLAYTQGRPDPTSHSVFWDHGSNRPPSNMCGAKIVATLGEAQFSACTH